MKTTRTNSAPAATAVPIQTRFHSIGFACSVFVQGTRILQVQTTGSSTPAEKCEARKDDLVHDRTSAELGRAEGARGRRPAVPVLDADVRQMARVGRAAPATRAAFRQHSEARAIVGEADGAVRPHLPAIPGRQAVRLLPDAHALPDGPRPGADRRHHHQGFCTLHRPRFRDRPVR